MDFKKNSQRDTEVTATGDHWLKYAQRWFEKNKHGDETEINMNAKDIILQETNHRINKKLLAKFVLLT